MRKIAAALGDRAHREAVRRLGIDARTSNYWNLVLGPVGGEEGEEHAS